jgi:uncharacterized ion transporter superfamily protein YfcC
MTERTLGLLPSLKRFRMPHTLQLVMGLVVFVLLLSWVVPSGEYQKVSRVVEGHARVLTLPGSYQQVAKVRLGLGKLLTAPLQGFGEASGLVAFLFVVGGAFAVLDLTGAVASGIRRLAAVLSTRPSLEKLLIPTLMVTFSLAGSVFGMSEEVIPFVLIFVPLARGLGYDALVGVAIPFLGAAAGFAAAFFNPFTVGIAQQLSGLPLFSGLGYRLFTWVVGTTTVTLFVMRYAARIKRHPQTSAVYDLEQAHAASQPMQTEGDPWRQRHGWVLSAFLAFLVVLVWGILRRGWFFEEIGALFLAMGILLGLIGGLKGEAIAKAFVAGAKEMVGVVLIVACAKALLVIAKDARILDTLLFYGIQAMSHLPRGMAAPVMFVVQAGINFFIHSGTSQAALTMPIMAPLSDLLGVSRQTMVYAFQLCEFINPILPTSAVTMGVLGAAKLPWERWAKWFLPLMGILVVLSLLLLIPPVLFFHYGPF